MQCPKCLHPETKVLDTRNVEDKHSIRRRRQCLECAHRFSTIESVLREGILVVKRDGRREDFSRQKLLTGIERATQKCPVTIDQVDHIVSGILQKIEREDTHEISSTTIGEWVMEALKRISHIAYVRFASIYKEFNDIDALKREISELESQSKS